LRTSTAVGTCRSEPLGGEDVEQPRLDVEQQWLEYPLWGAGVARAARVQLEAVVQALYRARVQLEAVVF
jgi:hypothetical protein